MGLNVLVIEAFCGGSHAAFVEGLVSHSRHRFEVVDLPARFWKWRMRGAALYLAPKVGDVSRFDALVTSNMMSLSDFGALMGPQMPPSLLYFHESQITYPLPPGTAMDMQFGFTDITSALAASVVCFNSAFHKDAFFRELPLFIRKMPEYRPNWVVPAIHTKTRVLHPGVALPGAGRPQAPERRHPPLVVWNHRWEFDKNPDAFFSALSEVSDRGIPFRVAVLGKNYQACPQAFLGARDRFGDRIVAWGHEPDRAAYHSWLRQGRVVVSTAIQENFGMSVIEAVHSGCLPLLPRRLSYPEIIPPEHHSAFLYDSQSDLVEKLSRLLAAGDAADGARRALSTAMAAYAWPEVIDGYDDLLEAVAAEGRSRGRRRRGVQDRRDGAACSRCILPGKRRP